MNYGGDAAEQVVRMSLEGVEVAARITGTGAKNIAILLAAVLCLSLAACGGNGGVALRQLRA